jgi:cell division protein FtsB
MNKGIIIFILLLVFNYLFLVFVFEFGSEVDTESYKDRIEQLENENRQLKSANSQLDQEVAQLTEEKDSLTSEIKITATAREILKSERDETMDRINGMDNNELYGFFSNFKTDGTDGRNGY